MKRPIPTPRRLTKPPAPWREDLEGVLISPDQLARRVRSLALEIQASTRSQELVVVALLNGTVLFLADLIRNLTIPLRLDFVGISSYGDGTVSREMIFTKELRLDVRGRHVLLVDDILDTGRTLSVVAAKLKRLNPASLKTCVLLDKPGRRQLPVTANFIGFKIPDKFVVGYGMDFAERYRNLPFVGVLRPERYLTPESSRA